MDADELDVRLADGELFHGDCGQAVAVEDGLWRCYDCEEEGDAPEVHPDDWMFHEGRWIKAVGDGTIALELYPDEMETWPPLVEMRAWKASAMVELARWDAVFEALGRPGRLGLAKAESCAALIERSLVIPRDAIPDGLVEFLDGWAEEIEDQPYAPMSASEMEDARRLRTAARLLSGGAS